MTEPHDRLGSPMDDLPDVGAVLAYEGGSHPPRSWSLPPEPPEDVRVESKVTIFDEGKEIPMVFARDRMFPEMWRWKGIEGPRHHWGDLLVRFGPLTEVVDSDA